ncbi:hypothetical protein PTSG_12744 [Salpingoeca rosetta]|uniref:RING-type E3 ubiquitin transferase n=1 Tax=Salpingoeca rosetta (strain ATCC 50818 / BSB-021) TaxID=946362 RepID=F2UJW4_SALR5|nr:uncharacterized protein PTSG_12744 [Salpingoeca rosetta]EGD77413.1 hypothetical protein PTSG_12744 [Salpingoeca rosetta]|eukprot:XP_004990757.1 hypothetical protein PTSG_12744 [Salpingoeca rosetta]
MSSGKSSLGGGAMRATLRRKNTEMVAPHAAASGSAQAEVELVPTSPSLPRVRVRGGPADPICIGRSEACDTTIENPYLSGTHCHLKLSDGKLFLKDTSSNGTQVEGKLVQRDAWTEVKRGDEITLVTETPTTAAVSFLARYRRTPQATAPQQADGNTEEEEVEELERRAPAADVEDAPPAKKSKTEHPSSVQGGDGGGGGDDEAPSGATTATTTASTAPATAEERGGSGDAMVTTADGDGDDADDEEGHIGAGGHENDQAASTATATATTAPATTATATAGTIGTSSTLTAGASDSDTTTTATAGTTAATAGTTAATAGTATTAVSSNGGEEEEEEDDMEENLLCSICRDVLHDAASLLPCLHTFCAGCCSQWLTSNSTCPDCRVNVRKMRRNHLVNNLVGVYLKSHPDKKRDAADIATLDAANQLKVRGKDELRFSARRRGWRDDDDYDDDDDDDDSNDDDDDGDFDGGRGGRVGRYGVRIGGFGMSFSFAPAPVALPPPRCAACDDASTNVMNFRCSGTGAAHMQCTCCRTYFPHRDLIAPSTTTTTAAATTTSTAATTTTPAATTATTPGATTPPVPASTGDDGDGDTTSSTTTGPADGDGDGDGDGGASSSSPPPSSTTAAAVSTPPPPVHCALCSRPFCNLFWTRGCRGPCTALGGCLRPLQDLTLVSSDLTAFINRNTYESQVMRDYLREKGMTPRDLLLTCIDRAASGALTAAAIGPVSRSTPTCRQCGLRVFNALAYEYRKALPASDLPRSAQVTPSGETRANCWYGYQCRTQHNRPHHAVRFNHPTHRPLGPYGPSNSSSPSAPRAPPYPGTGHAPPSDPSSVRYPNQEAWQRYYQHFNWTKWWEMQHKSNLAWHGHGRHPYPSHPGQYPVKPQSPQPTPPPPTSTAAATYTAASTTDGNNGHHRTRWQDWRWLTGFFISVGCIFALTVGIFVFVFRRLPSSSTPANRSNNEHMQLLAEIAQYDDPVFMPATKTAASGPAAPVNPAPPYDVNTAAGTTHTISISISNGNSNSNSTDSDSEACFQGLVTADHRHHDHHQQRDHHHHGHDSASSSEVGCSSSPWSSSIAHSDPATAASNSSADHSSPGQHSHSHSTGSVVIAMDDTPYNSSSSQQQQQQQQQQQHASLLPLLPLDQTTREQKQTNSQAMALPTYFRTDDADIPTISTSSCSGAANPSSPSPISPAAVWSRLYSLMTALWPAAATTSSSSPTHQHQHQHQRQRQHHSHISGGGRGGGAITADVAQYRRLLQHLYPRHLLDRAHAHRVLPLRTAVLLGDVDQLSALLEDTPPSLLAATDAAGRTLLHEAVLSRSGLDVALIAMLLRHRCPTEVPDLHGRTPLLCACELSKPAAVRAMAAGGADVNARDAMQQTGLMIACARNDADVASALLTAGADSALADGRGYTAMHWCCATGAVEAMTRLSAFTSRLVEVKTGAGDTCLHLAAREANEAVIKVLMGERASVRAVLLTSVNAFGQRAEDAAAAANHHAIARHLQQHRVALEQDVLCGRMSLKDRAPRRRRHASTPAGDGEDDGDAGRHLSTTRPGSKVGRAMYMRKHRHRHKVISQLRETRVRHLEGEGAAIAAAVAALKADRHSLMQALAAVSPEHLQRLKGRKARPAKRRALALVKTNGSAAPLSPPLAPPLAASVAAAAHGNRATKANRRRSLSGAAFV